MYRVRIKKMPRMEEGGDVQGVRTVLPQVDRMSANIEAERGETIFGKFGRDGLGEHYKIGGERHSQGGTPLLVPEGSFVFSDTKKLKIGGPVLAEFGKDPKSKRKYTPAELAKQYNVNKYKALLGGELSDKYDKDTAQVMLDNYERKLAKLALMQEAMKGFPQGVPAMAVPLLEEMGVQLGGEVGAGPMPQDDSGMGPMEMMPPGGGMGPMGMMPPGMEGMPPGGEGEMGPMGPEAGMMGMAPGMPMPGGMMPPGMEGMMMPPPGMMGAGPEEEMAEDEGGLSAEQEYDRDVIGSPMEERYGGMTGYGRMPSARYGGSMAHYGGRDGYELPKAQVGIISPAMIPMMLNWALRMGHPNTGTNPGPGTKPKPTVPVYGGNQHDLTSAYQKSKGLSKDFNKFDASWLPQYGYENTGEGIGQALIDAGYTGDLNNTLEIQKFLIRKNVEKGNYKLFNDMMEKWGVTTQGGKKGLKDDLRFAAEKDPALAAKILEQLDMNFADADVGVRTGELMRGAITKRDPKKDKVVVKKPVVSLPGPQVGSFDPVASRPDIGMPWWMVDKLKTGAALAKRFDLLDIGPTMVRGDYYDVPMDLADYTRARMAGQEAANMQTMATNMNTDPRLARAMSSRTQGVDIDNSAKLWGQEQAQNVGWRNQAAAATREGVNRNFQLNREWTKQYIDEDAVKQQQLKNTKDLADMNILNNVSAGIENSLEAYWLNRMNKQFQVDPETGRLFFLRGNEWAPLNNQTGGGPGSDYFTAYQYHLDHGDPTDLQGAREYAQWKSGMKGSKSSSDDDDYGANMIKNYFRRGKT